MRRVSGAKTVAPSSTNGDDNDKPEWEVVHNRQTKMMKMGEAAYQADQAAGPDGAAPGADGEETVVDAEFEEVDDSAEGDKK